MKVLGIHADVCNLGGHTRLFLTMMDVFKGMGFKAHIVARTHKPTVADVDFPTHDPKTAKPLLLPARFKSTVGRPHHTLKQLRKFEPLRYIGPNDVSLHDIPVVYWGTRFLTPWAPEVLQMIEDADYVFCDTEMYVRLETDLDIADKHIQFIHFPLQTLMPVYGKEPRRIWANSTFTRSWIRIRWGYNNPNYTKVGRKYTNITIPNCIFNSEVVHPPLYVEDYYNTRWFDERPFDVVMFSRLASDKFTVAGFLDKHFKLLTMGASSIVKVAVEKHGMEVITGEKQVESKVSKPFKPKGEVHKTVTFKEITELLRKAKVYVHGRGFTMPDGEVSEPEHFGITICEAMASGCPAIIPRVGGCWTDISMNGKYALGYSSLEELREIVQTLTTKKEEWEKWHNLALERVEAFDVSNIRTRVKELLHD